MAPKVDWEDVQENPPDDELHPNPGRQIPTGMLDGNILDEMIMLMKSKDEITDDRQKPRITLFGKYYEALWD